MRKRSELQLPRCSLEEAFLQPWFVGRDCAEAIRRIVPEDFARKMRFYFDDWGCLVCGSKRRRYECNGMCHACAHRTKKRLLGCLKKRRTEIAAVRNGATTPLMDEMVRVRTARLLLSDLARRG